VRIVKRGAAIRNKPALRVAGIDDWSWQQGRRYGTMIVDLERRQVVDVLLERSADMTAEWRCSMRVEAYRLSRKRPASTGGRLRSGLHVSEANVTN
jgi:hypothetical protein